METKGNVEAGTTVLIVDDDADTRDILIRALGSAGYRVLEAEDGASCLATVRTETVDVILLDVMMPGIDGLAVCKELQTIDRARHVPVILLTAKDDVETRAAGMRLGVSEYVTKPVNIQEVLTRVRNQSHVRTIQQQLDESTERLGELTGDKAAQ